MSWVREFSGAGTSASSFPVAVPATIPAGHLLVLGLSCINDGTLSCTDSKGNTWVLDQKWAPTATVAAQFSCIVETPLSNSDTITVSHSSSATRWAVSVQQFDDLVTSRDDANYDESTTSTTALSAGAISSDDTSALYVGSFSLVNSGRTFTPGSGWVGGTKVISTGGSGNRAVVMVWRWGSGTQTPQGSLNNGGTYCAVSRAFGLDSDEPPPPPELPLTPVVGGSKKTVSDVAVVVGGVTKTVTGLAVVKSGVKIPLL